MNENIDLTKILKNCPEGWKFYSSIYGEVEFVGIKHKSPVPYDYPIRFKIQGDEFCVSSAGEHLKGIGECTFFPSYEQRDWSKFTTHWYRKGKEQQTKRQSIINIVRIKLNHLKIKYIMYMLDQLVLSLLDTINEIHDEDKNNDISELKKALLKYAKNKQLNYE